VEHLPMIGEREKGKGEERCRIRFEITLLTNVNGTETDPAEFALYFHTFTQNPFPLSPQQNCPMPQSLLPFWMSRILW
jgi:hypothetical protein